jgi:methyl-accepting chemotaxis protein
LRFRAKLVEIAMAYQSEVGPQNDRLGIGKRVVRAIVRFVLAALIGVAATLSWQSYGDEAKEMIRTSTPSLGWLIPPSTMKSATADASSAEFAQQLKPIALDLATVRRSVEQLAANQQQLAANQQRLAAKQGEMAQNVAAKQDEIAQNIAALQAIEQKVGDKISSLPASKPARTPARRPPLHPTPSNSQTPALPPR